MSRYEITSPDMATDAINGLVTIRWICSRCGSEDVVAILRAGRTEPDGYSGDNLCRACILPDDGIIEIPGCEETPDDEAR